MNQLHSRPALQWIPLLGHFPRESLGICAVVTPTRASVYDTKTEAVVDTFWFRYMYLLEKKILEIFWFRYISSKAHFAYADRDSSEKRYTSGSKNETASNCKQLTNGMTGWRYIGLENMAEHRGRHSSYWFNDWQALR